MTIKRCGGCKFWEFPGQYSADQENEKHEDERRGTCRRSPPLPTRGEFEYQLLKHLTHISWLACSDSERKTDFKDWEEACFSDHPVWPTTFSGDWCGEWREKDGDS